MSFPLRISEISLSTGGNINGSISITVTLHPRELKIFANSMPITPPPIITILLGIESKLKAPVLSITPSNSLPSIGGIKGMEPDEIITLSNWIFSLSP